MSGIDDTCVPRALEYGADQAASGLASSEPVVSVRGLVKRYGSHEVVVFAVWRAVAQRRAFLCPECGAAVQTS